MSKSYYSLRFERTDTFHRSGEQLLNSDNPLHIGQTESCDVRLVNRSQYEDAVLAIIEPCPDGQGWKLVRMSPFKEHEVRVNGVPVNYVHFLADGDRIAFEGQLQELTFGIRSDDEYTSGLITVTNKGHRSMIVWLTIVSIAIIGFALHYLYTRPVNQTMIENASQSIYQIKVEYVLLTVTNGDGTITIDSCYCNDQAGTAFLTTDGQLVTARHCLEPWLDIANEKAMDTVGDATSHFVKMALKATTMNIMEDDSRWQMVSYCSLCKPEIDGKIMLPNLTSNDFIMDKSRDNIEEYGDFDHQYFWRSIRSRSSHLDMMLGDIAYLPHADKLLGAKGTIKTATCREMQQLCRNTSRQLTILGRTENTIGNFDIESEEATMKAGFTDENFKDGYPNRVIAHEGTIGHGFSGGPVIVRKGLFGWRAIGVISLIDIGNNRWSYSVPVTEVERMENEKTQQP